MPAIGCFMFVGTARQSAVWICQHLWRLAEIPQPIATCWWIVICWNCLESISRQLTVAEYNCRRAGNILRAVLLTSNVTTNDPTNNNFVQNHTWNYRGTVGRVKLIMWDKYIKGIKNCNIKLIKKFLIFSTNVCIQMDSADRHSKNFSLKILLIVVLQFVTKFEFLYKSRVFRNNFFVNKEITVKSN